MTKQTILTFFLLIFLINYTIGQKCSYTIGDYYDLIQSGANIREAPSTNGKLIGTINTINLGNVGFEILSDSVENSFVKIKILILQPEYNLELAPFDSVIAWIHTSLIEYDFGVYAEGFSIDYYNDKIEEQRLAKIRNECNYSTDLYAHVYSQRGIINYNNRDYSSAISDLTKSIKISSTYKYIIRTYIYRGFAKQELQDYLGAINDFDFSIRNCKHEKYNLICDICGLYKDKVAIQIMGINYPEFCNENLLVQKAICYAMLKNYQTAMTNLNSAIALNSDYGEAYFIRGQIKDILNDNAGCCSDLSKAGELGLESAYDEIKKRCNK